MLTGEILRLSAARHPRHTALIHDGQRIAYGLLDLRANRFANAALALGIGKGEAIAVMGRNVPEYVVAHFGTARTGALLVNAMPAYAPDELVEILGRTRVRLIVVEEAFQAKIAEAINRLPNIDHVVVIGAPSRPGWTGFDDFLASAGDDPPAVRLSETDPFAMTFTGGTTGLPKGALVSHRARSESCWITAIEHEVGPGDVVGVLTPFYHAMGSLVWMPTAMLLGATAVIQTGWDPDGFIDAVAEHGITCTLMVPVQLQQILSADRFDAEKLSTLRKIACGGAITPAGDRKSVV